MSFFSCLNFSFPHLKRYRYLKRRGILKKSSTFLQKRLCSFHCSLLEMLWWSMFLSEAKNQLTYTVKFVSKNQVPYSSYFVHLTNSGISRFTQSQLQPPTCTNPITITQNQLQEVIPTRKNSLNSHTHPYVLKSHTYP